jgi:hypothetical protein
MTNEIKITEVGEDEVTGYKRYIEFEYDGQTYTGWFEWDAYEGFEWVPIYGDFAELFNKMGGEHLDNGWLGEESYKFQIARELV